MRRVARTTSVIQFFTALFPDLFALLHEDFEDVQLNDMEIHRLQRGLWRFETCCALVGAWKPSIEASLDKVRSGKGSCMPPLTQYLGRFVPWELEEIACVYEYLELAVVSTVFSLPLTYLPHNVHSSVEGQGYGNTTRRGELKQLISGAELNMLCWYFKSAGRTVFLGSPLRHTATEDCILSQGLIFLRAFQRLPLAAKSLIQTKLNGRHQHDGLLHAALSSSKEYGQHRFSLEQRRQFAASRSLWNATDSYKEDPSFIERTDMANDRWQDLIEDNFPAFHADRGLYDPPHGRFRSCGYSIWSRPRSCTITEEDVDYDCIGDESCKCHFCMDRWS